MASAGLKPDKLGPYLATLRQQFPRSKELGYAEIDLAIRRRDFAAARPRVATLISADPYDWKAWFLEGRIAFIVGDFKTAAERFARIRAELPGEPAAQLALALALEAFGEPAAAEPIYDRVSKADPSYASAAFGLARCRLAPASLGPNERARAIEALGRVPSTSALYVAARTSMVRIIDTDPPGKASSPRSLHELKQAADILSALSLDTQATHLAGATLLIKAAECVEGGASGTDMLLGCRADARSLRFGAEKELRRAARLETNPEKLVALVDRANQARPRTLF